LLKAYCGFTIFSVAIVAGIATSDQIDAALINDIKHTW
jgi:hypothetical protein